VTDLGFQLASAKVYELSQPLHDGMPFSPSHPGFRRVLHRRHGDVVREDGGSAAADLVVMGTHTGTHIDALAHVSQHGRLHGGHDAADAQAGGSFTEHGIDTLGPLVGSGVLVDVAGAAGVEALAGGEAVGREQLEAAERFGGEAVRAGDVVLVRTGWARNYDAPESFIGRESGVPGVDVSGADWLVARGARATGSDTLAYEQILPGQGHRTLPVHSLLLVANGIPIIEMLNLEQLSRDGVYRFAFVLAPLRLLGATGSPVAPLAFVQA
jgi:kynurenine formamidase